MNKLFLKLTVSQQWRQRPDDGGIGGHDFEKNKLELTQAGKGLECWSIGVKVNSLVLYALL